MKKAAPKCGFGWLNKMFPNTSITLFATVFSLRPPTTVEGQSRNQTSIAVKIQIGCSWPMILPKPELSVGRENAIGYQSVGVSAEVFAMKLSLPLFKLLLDVNQAIFLHGESPTHDDPPAKEAHESPKALLYRNLQANDVRSYAICATVLRDRHSQV
jgi:hypothetical protein